MTDEIDRAYEDACIEVCSNGHEWEIPAWRENGQVFPKYTINTCPVCGESVYEI